jgi:flagellar biogenesis protein FliO
MDRSALWIATLMFCSTSAGVRAEATPAPPDWQDGGSSIYQANILHSPAAIPAVAEIPAKASPAVEPAAHQQVGESAAMDASKRHLAPPSGRKIATGGEVDISLPLHNREPAWRGRFEFGLPFASLYTMCSGLAVVVGAFLLFAWLLRRGTKTTTAVLPADVVSVLGRVSLSASQSAQLLRVGNKLVLVSVAQSGAETLTEITDPDEVERLLGLCQQYNPHSTTKAFEQVFRQLSSEPSRNSFLENDSLPPTLSSAAATYRSYRGEATRA